MAKLALILFTVLLTTVIASPTENNENKCSPWLGYCLVYEDCCRDLQCASYLAKCIPIGGLKVPGKDKRPIGPGPHPPGHILYPGEH